MATSGLFSPMCEGKEGKETIRLLQWLLSKGKSIEMAEGNFVFQRIVTCAQENVAEFMASTSSIAKAYDLWGDEDTNEQAKPKKSARSKYIPSVLTAVEIPAEGASYNPSLDSYLEYVGQIAKEEAKVLANEKRNNRMFVKTVEDQYLAPVFKSGEEIFDTILETEVKEEVKGEDAVDFPVTDDQTAKNPTKLPKKLAGHELVKEKKLRAKSQQLESLKSIKKAVKKTIEDRENLALSRAKQRTIDNLTKNKKLGRGKYEKLLEPALLTSELTGSMRTVKCNTSIFRERINSLQKRNILPIAGDHQKKALKQRLKAKFVEKRSVKEITKGSVSSKCLIVVTQFSMLANLSPLVEL
uniref:Ribosome biogenesis protein NOP53 n=1 Tax=Ditylenchus dipsaci TaxID=166011 RepID=A0A915EJK2_9BILA